MNIPLQRCYSSFRQFERSKTGQKPVDVRDLEQSADPVAEANYGKAASGSLARCVGAHN